MPAVLFVLVHFAAMYQPYWELCITLQLTNGDSNKLSGPLERPALLDFYDLSKTGAPIVVYGTLQCILVFTSRLLTGLANQVMAWLIYTSRDMLVSRT